MMGQEPLQLRWSPLPANSRGGETRHSPIIRLEQPLDHMVLDDRLEFVGDAVGEVVADLGV